MNRTRSFLYGILHVKCPKCREGNMFPEETLYTTSFADMHETCPNCQQNLEQEPGFYYGAMYVSFAFNVGIFLISLFLLSLFVEEITLPLMAGVVISVVVGFLPIIFRLSRAIWINIFIRYEKPIKQVK
ncbi:DUF983 domain-containing protein [Adhaeribacter aquaticus]|uniref:DUF983 domain-containing protein n=1 Tax=Adhaeribacter aquaticus TaxID=299567 RepID=UPI00047D9696|nr:DUF983 domain-containing protein [Adhaeribacter aquaticus]